MQLKTNFQEICIRIYPYYKFKMREKRPEEKNVILILIDQLEEALPVLILRIFG